jgi:hypothetical protein
MTIGTALLTHAQPVKAPDSESKEAVDAVAGKTRIGRQGGNITDCRVDIDSFAYLEPSLSSGGREILGSHRIATNRAGVLRPDQD